MGRKKKGFNWKARQAVETIIDKSEQNKIKVEFSGGSYDDCNALALPSSKRETKVKKKTTTVTKLLSKTQRKKLEKIVERKKKKENRGTLIEELSKVQIPDDELRQLTSLSAVQTKGLKRRWDEDKEEAIDSNGCTKKVNSIKGSKRKLRLLALTADDNLKKSSDPNVVGFENSSDEDEESDHDSTASEPGHLDCEIYEHDNEEELSLRHLDVVNVTDEEDNHVSVPENDRLSSDKSNSITNGKSIKLRENKQIKSEPAVFVRVDRKPEIQIARLKLPIIGEEQVIMEAVKENQIVVIAGETGSGKTTQLPQFLYEAGYTKNGKLIGVTEPRRVAAISMSKRVAEELSLASDKVSYLIRFEGNSTPETEIKFMTDGVLLKEMQSDFLLSKYSVVILDEAHERSVYTDILVGLLSRIVPLRNKKGDLLKMIIMSATLRLEDFTNNAHLFKTPPPVIKVESRQYPVTVHFNKRTNPDYIKEAYKKACRIHTTLPEGGILIFLTGQQEVNLLVKKLKNAFPYKKNRSKENNEEKLEKADDEEEELDLDKIMEKVKKKKKKSESEIKLPEINLDNYESGPNDDTQCDLLDLVDSENEEESWQDDIYHPSSQPLWVLPLYSLLPSYKQAKVFGKIPEGCRLCVVATNVAETSLTIPGVKYVVDTGKVKSKFYDKVTGVSSFCVVWTSKAAANQRAGRAGRTSPGHCYRLYSSAIYNDEFEEWAVPEMQRRGVDDLVLQMKSLGIDKVSNFPFPSPPDREQLLAAEHRLTVLGALNPSKGAECSGTLTPLGISMSAFPVSPRFAKMLCLSHQYNLLEYTVAVVAALSVQEFLMASDNQKTKAIWRSWAGKGNALKLGDVMVLLRGICGGEYAHSKGELAKFCSVHGIREKAVVEARKLRLQITKEINLSKPELNLIVDPLLKPPTDLQAKLLRQILLAGLVDRVAKKCTDSHEKKGKKRAVYRTPEMEDDVYIHSSSALYKEEPQWVVYQEIYQTNKMYMRSVTDIEADWLPKFAANMCSLSPPLDLPPPRYDPDTGQLYCHVNATFGRSGWELPLVEIEFPSGLDRYKWFSIFFLNGSMFPKLKKYASSLLVPAHTMVKPWAKLQDRTELFLKTLASESVDSKDKLLDVWKSKSKFLLPVYLKWLPESAENDVITNWPPI